MSTIKKAESEDDSEEDEEDMMNKRNFGIKKGRQKITLKNCFSKMNMRDEDERSWQESSRKYTTILEDSQEMEELMETEERRKKHLNIKFRETFEKYEDYVKEIGRTKESEK